MTSNDTQIEEFIRDTFEQNYELLRLQGAGALSQDVRETALQQALFYWRKLRDIAESVTDTEVKLTLLGQTTPAGREFAIDGVVDIVREDTRTLMYDIKTHDADYVRANRGLYEQQLNVYAHIWQELRGEPLDSAAVLATNLPDRLREAIDSDDQQRIQHELDLWQPVVPIPYDPTRVQATVDEFAEVVDAIEDGQFEPRPVRELHARLEPSRTLFATRICRTCDARFSCQSYRQYALEGRGSSDRVFQEYFSDPGPDLDQENWRTANLLTARPTEDLERDLTG